MWLPFIHNFVYSLADQPSSPSKILTKKSNNFYKDSNVEEVKNCYHILEELKTKITEFLEEWPDQPTLKTVIYSFIIFYLFITHIFAFRYLKSLIESTPSI